MKSETTWKDIYRTFKTIYPKLSSEALGFRPYGIAEILVYFPNGERMVYDDLQRRVYYIAKEAV